MKFQCLNCEKQFLYPLKQEVLAVSTDPIPAISSTDATQSASTWNTTSTTHRCPYCGSLNIDEIPAEPKQEQSIDSAVQVLWDEVDSYLKQGYVIVERYAKNATLFKYSEENESE